MLCKKMTYKNFNGETVTEEFYFNLTDRELVKLELSEEGGMTAVVKMLSSEKNPQKIYQIFERIVEWAYGEKTADGRFPKSPEILARFQSTQAYSDLVMEMLTDAKAGAQFIQGLVTAERLAAAQARAEAESNQPKLPSAIQFSEPDGVVVDNPNPEIEPYAPSRVATNEMTREELIAEMRRFKDRL